VDGRKMDDYYQWLQNLAAVRTLPMAVYTSAAVPYGVKAMLRADNLVAHTTVELHDLRVWSRRPLIASILDDPQWRASIPHPGDICMRHPDYNIVQYAKFEFLMRTIKRNPFGSTHFVWLDAGITRHLNDEALQKAAVPLLFEGDKLYIGCSPSAALVQNGTRMLGPSFVGTNENILVGTVFGGSEQAVTSLCRKTFWALDQLMLANHRVDNEQIAMALVLQHYPRLFRLVVSPHFVSYEWWAMLTQKE
jgi:hypothetical protein